MLNLYQSFISIVKKGKLYSFIYYIIFTTVFPLLIPNILLSKESVLNSIYITFLFFILFLYFYSYKYVM